MLRLNWQLALLVFIPGPAVVLAMRRLFLRSRRLYRRYLRARSRPGTIVHDSLIGVRVVNAFGREEFKISQFRLTNEEVRSTQWSTMRFAGRSVSAASSPCPGQWAIRVGCRWLARGEQRVNSGNVGIVYWRSSTSP